MYQASKKRIIAVVRFTAITVILFFVFLNVRTKPDIETFPINNGYGYLISVKGKTVVYQPYIPALEGKNSFKTRSEAKKTAKIVVRKIINNEEPSVTIEDLKKAGIIKNK
ncbi:MAG TPA: DUF4907 domain-containing protein [Bacteroidales bacterium]|nr:DUF4907 domain-containing protein [Bacteroidales bacterium]